MFRKLLKVSVTTSRPALTALSGREVWKQLYTVLHSLVKSRRRRGGGGGVDAIEQLGPGGRVIALDGHFLLHSRTVLSEDREGTAVVADLLLLQRR